MLKQLREKWGISQNEYNHFNYSKNIIEEEEKSPNDLSMNKETVKNNIREGSFS